MTASSEARSEGQSYSQILKSTILMGGSSAVNVGFSIVRNKAVAVMLGPEGIGLIALYTSIADMAQTLAGLGVQQSGVRQIAEAVGSGDSAKIARTVYILRVMSLLLGVAGTAVLLALALPVSRLTFGDDQHVLGIALLALSIVFRVVSAGQMALIQGMRSIGSLAIINVLAAFSSVVITIPLLYLWGIRGIVPSLVAIAAAGLAASWWYSRKVSPGRPSDAIGIFREDAAMLLQLGLVFMAGALLMSGSAYAIRIIVLHAGGVFAAGLYQSAWALGGLYAGFILQAMGTDFYPRLTAVSQDNAACNRLVNEQAQVGLLLAGPGVIATLTFAPIVLHLLYTPEFQAAADVLRWICLGMVLRIVSWPMGYIIIAKGAQAIFFCAEFAGAVVHVGLAWLLVAQFGTTGAGAAFFGLYLWHGILVYVIVRRMSGFRWSVINFRLGAIFFVVAGVTFAAMQMLPLWPATVFGSLVVLSTGLYSLKMLAILIPPAAMPRSLRALLSRFS